MSACQFSVLFLVALAAGCALHLWLQSRQIRHVGAHRDAVPADFSETIPLAAHQRAADYTVAKLRFGLLDGVEEFVKIQADEDGVVRGNNLKGERLPVDPAELVSMNFWLFSPSFIELTEDHFIDFLKEHGQEPKSECFIPTVVDALIHEDRADCAVLPTSSTWFGMTYPGDKPMVVEGINKLIKQGVYPEKLN